MIWTYWSPLDPPLKPGIPLPFILKRVPLWVPEPKFIFALDPSIHGTWIELPKTASIKDTGTSIKVSFPSLWNNECSFISINIYKSPGDDPLAPASPSPERRILVPLSTPAGTFTDNFLFLLTRPWPLQGLHGSPIISPTPEHEAQVLSIVKKPCWALILPYPPHWLHCLGLEPLFAPEPLHDSHLEGTVKEISTWSPLKACSREIDKSYLKSEPVEADLLPESPPIPNMSSKISEKPPLPNPEKPPEAPAPWEKAAWPYWLYAAFFWGSLRTS